MRTVTLAGSGGTKQLDGVRSTGIELRVAADETVLLAGLRAGLAMPYECASGGCGTCKAQLLDGEVDTLWANPTGLTDRDRRRGDRVLLCQSRPRTACTVKLPGGLPMATATVTTAASGTAGAAPGPNGGPGWATRPARMRAEVIGLERLSQCSAVLTVRCDRAVAYLAGQFAVLELPDGTRRAYSMSREPGADPLPELEFLIRAKPGGAATGWLFDRLTPGDALVGAAMVGNALVGDALNGDAAVGEGLVGDAANGHALVGDELIVEAPYGRAHAQSPSDRPAVCIGGGSGLGPMLAVAERLLTESPAREVTLHYGARDATDLVLGPRLARLLERGATVHVAVDRPDGEPAPSWPTPVRTGMVVDVVETLHDDAAEPDLYLAGPTPMVDAVLARLVRTARVRADRVFFDRFV